MKKSVIGFLVSLFAVALVQMLPFLLRTSAEWVIGIHIGGSLVFLGTATTLLFLRTILKDYAKGALICDIIAWFKRQEIAKLYFWLGGLLLQSFIFVFIQPRLGQMGA